MVHMFKKIIVVFCLVFSISQSHASMLSFELTGIVSSADEGNAYELAEGDTITATGTFDDRLLNSYHEGFGSFDGRYGLLVFSSGSGNSLSITFGTNTYTEVDDDDYLVEFPYGFPTLNLIPDEMLISLSFRNSQEDGSFFRSNLDYFNASDTEYRNVYGTWDFSSMTNTTVPIPAAVWLLGSGLAGLIYLARHKRL